MARPVRCFATTTLILITALSASPSFGNPIARLLSKEWIPLKRDCLPDMLATLRADKKIPAVELKKLEGAANYNDQIFVKFGDLPRTKWNAEIEKTIDHYAAYNLGFDSASFKRWVKENPMDVTEQMTIGKYLEEQNVRFMKKHPSGKITDEVADIAEEMKAIAKECGSDVKCNEDKIAAALSKKQSLCFMKPENRKSALQSMITGIAFANAGYAATTVQDPNHDYPYDLTLTNLIWTPIMTELGCRADLGGGKIGKKVDLNKKVYLSSEWRTRAGNKYISYMILSPLSNMTYVGFHTAKQLIQGKVKWEDVHLWDLTKQVGSLTLYDAIYPVPRMVLLTDPLYLKGVPSFNKYLTQRWGKVPANATSLSVDWGSRFGLSYVNSALVNVWISKSDEWWDTKFAPKKHVDASAEKEESK